MEKNELVNQVLIVSRQYHRLKNIVQRGREYIRDPQVKQIFIEADDPISKIDEAFKKIKKLI